MSTDHAHLRALAEAATPGPWVVTWAPEYEHDEDRALPVTIEHPLDVCRSVLVVDDENGEALNAANAEFMAEANPSTVLALLDEIADLRRGQGKIR